MATAEVLPGRSNSGLELDHGQSDAAGLVEHQVANDPDAGTGTVVDRPADQCVGLVADRQDPGRVLVGQRPQGLRRCGVDRVLAGRRLLRATDGLVHDLLHALRISGLVLLHALQCLLDDLAAARLRGSEPGQRQEQPKGGRRHPWRAAKVIHLPRPPPRVMPSASTPERAKGCTGVAAAYGSTKVAVLASSPGTALDRLVEVLRGGAEILGLHLGRLRRRQAGQAAARVEVVLDQDGLASRVHHLVRDLPELDVGHRLVLEGACCSSAPGARLGLLPRLRRTPRAVSSR